MQRPESGKVGGSWFRGRKNRLVGPDYENKRKSKIGTVPKNKAIVIKIVESKERNVKPPNNRIKDQTSPKEGEDKDLQEGTGLRFPALCLFG